MEGPSSQVSHKGPGSLFPPMGPGSPVPGEGSQMEDPGSRVPHNGPWSQVPGPRTHFPGMPSKNVSQIFKILFQTGDINIFVLHGVFFSRYVHLKSSLSDESNISGEI